MISEATAETSPHPPPDRTSLATLRRLGPYVRPHRRALLGGGAAALGATLSGLAVPLVTRAIVDGPAELLAGEGAFADLHAAWRASLA